MSNSSPYINSFYISVIATAVVYLFTKYKMKDKKENEDPNHNYPLLFLGVYILSYAFIFCFGGKKGQSGGNATVKEVMDNIYTGEPGF
jgi:hypothetical protein